MHAHTQTNKSLTSHLLYQNAEKVTKRRRKKKEKKGKKKPRPLAGPRVKTLFVAFVFCTVPANFKPDTEHLEFFSFCLMLLLCVYCEWMREKEKERNEVDEGRREERLRREERGKRREYTAYRI